jgi:hypothetical protein
MTRTVVVASGTLDRVVGWVMVLTDAAIRYRMVRATELADDHTELWVDRDDADEAQAAIRATCAGARLIW